MAPDPGILEPVHSDDPRGTMNRAPTTDKHNS